MNDLLANRYRRVVLNGQMSKPTPVKCSSGVNTWTYLLFNLYK